MKNDNNAEGIKKEIGRVKAKRIIAYIELANCKDVHKTNAKILKRKSIVFELRIRMLKGNSSLFIVIAMVDYCCYASLAIFDCF